MLCSQPGSARRHHHLGPHMLQLALGKRPFHVHVEGVVAGAEGHALHPRAGSGDFPRRGDALRRLDDRDDVDAAGRQAALPLQPGDQPVEGDDLLAAFAHGEDDAVEPRPDDRRRVAVAELRLERIHPNVAAAAARLLQSFDYKGAGSHLLRLGDRVLEIEDDVIRAAAEHLLDLARMVAGGEEEAAESGHGTAPVRISG